MRRLIQFFLFAFLLTSLTTGCIQQNTDSEKVVQNEIQMTEEEKQIDRITRTVFMDIRVKHLMETFKDSKNDWSLSIPMDKEGKVTSQNGKWIVRLMKNEIPVAEIVVNKEDFSIQLIQKITP